MPYIFEWDPAKAAENLRKHGVSFDEATEAFGDPLSINMPDPGHIRREERFLVLAFRQALGSILCGARRPHPTNQRSFSQPL